MWAPSYNPWTCLHENPSPWCLLLWGSLALWLLLALVGSYVWLSIARSVRSINSKLTTTRLMRSSKTIGDGYARPSTSLESSKTPPLIPSAIKGILLLMIVTVGVLAHFAFSQAGVVEMHNVYVVRNVNAYDYELRTAEGVKFFTRFCPDYEPQFSTGQTLTLLKFRDMGACWSLGNASTGYLIERSVINDEPIVRQQ